MYEHDFICFMCISDCMFVYFNACVRILHVQHGIDSLNLTYGACVSNR